MDKGIIKNNFSKYAFSYDDHSFIQRKCAEKLLELIGDRQFSRVLEIGCGTGVYTGLLHDKFRKADINAIDISSDMVSIAREKMPFANIDFNVADGEGLTINGTYDLITSNASFQWFDDLDSSFEVFSEHIDDNGLFCFSIYGPETFYEFKEVLRHHYKNSPGLSSSKFIKKKEVKLLLEKYFQEFELIEETFTADFFSLWEFLKNIKHSGTRGEGLGNKIFLGKYILKEIEKTYINKFKGIIATHHIYFCKARNPVKNIR